MKPATRLDPSGKVVLETVAKVAEVLSTFYGRGKEDWPEHIAPAKAVLAIIDYTEGDNAF